MVEESRQLGWVGKTHGLGFRVRGITVPFCQREVWITSTIYLLVFKALEYGHTEVGFRVWDGMRVWASSVGGFGV